MEFVPFPKLSRISRDMVITEKLDGTNAQIYIAPANEIGPEGLSPDDPAAVFQNTYALGFKDGMAIYAGSRTRWIKVGDDNYGFAGWVTANADELFYLGEGSHFGEWWGQGIQRRYDQEQKRFFLFNTARWSDDNRPGCCGVVPVLYEGPFDTAKIDDVLFALRESGSVAAPGFMNPEGIVIYHTHSRTLFKKTLDNNDEHKGLL